MTSKEKTGSRLGMLERGMHRAEAGVRDRFARAAEFVKEGGSLLRPGPANPTSSGDEAAASNEAVAVGPNAAASGQVAGLIRVEALRLQAVDPKTRKPKVVSRQYPITFGGAKRGVLREWESGRVALEVEFKSASAREAFVSLVRTHLVDQAGAPAED
jgi:hypothetical protein